MPSVLMKPEAPVTHRSLVREYFGAERRLCIGRFAGWPPVKAKGKPKFQVAVAIDAGANADARAAARAVAKDKARAAARARAQAKAMGLPPRRRGRPTRAETALRATMMGAEAPG